MAKEFAISEGIRIEITNEQSKQIRDLYKELSQEYKRELSILSTRSNISSQMRTQYLKDYVKELERDIEYLNRNIESTITSNMLRMSKAVVDDSISLDKKMGFNGIYTKQFYIPQDVVAIVSSGKLYDGKWSLSKAIWSDNQKKIDDINSIVAKGIAGNKTTYEIAKDLERYVNPRARKLWDWSKVYPHTSKKIDYNAQRLARTMVSHAYQESFVESTKDNPFIEKYRWLASGGDRMCPVCADRDGQIYDKDSLPMDHPNGMCTFEVVIEKSYEEIGKELADWVNGEGDPELNSALDDYAETLGYNVKSMTAVSEPVINAEMNNKGVQRETGLEFLNNMNDIESSGFADYQIMKIAEKWNISEDEVRSILTDTTKRLVDENDIGVCVNPDILSQILKSGFKNQYQVGDSSGTFNPDLRKEAEEKMFGISKNASDAIHPIYASLIPKDMTNEVNKEYFISGDATGVYGRACCILKKEAVINNSSITIDDSLNNYESRTKTANVIGTPINDINIKTIGSESGQEFRYCGIETVKNGSLAEIMKSGTYFEVQIYGEQSKSVDNIEKILFKRSEPDSELKSLLNQMNIPWESIDDD